MDSYDSSINFLQYRTKCDGREKKEISSQEIFNNLQKNPNKRDSFSKRMTPIEFQNAYKTDQDFFGAVGKLLSLELVTKITFDDSCDKLKEDILNESSKRTKLTSRFEDYFEKILEENKNLKDKIRDLEENVVLCVTNLDFNKLQNEVTNLEKLVYTEQNKRTSLSSKVEGLEEAFYLLDKYYVDIIEEQKNLNKNIVLLDKNVEKNYVSTKSFTQHIKTLGKQIRDRVSWNAFLANSGYKKLDKYNN